MLKYPDINEKCKFDIKEEKRVFCLLMRALGETTHFMSEGTADTRRGPGDKIGTSYAFDLFDFARRTYAYDY